jgi:transcriptional regulator with PAS, ATPase and Fis domain
MNDFPGMIAAAEGSTLFLDEISEMPAELQTRFLRVLQEREYRPLGSTKTLKADFRVIAATNRPISSALAENRLRADLYYRLNTFQIEVPPLRERKEDIPPLVATFLKRFATELGKPEPEIAPEAFQKLLDYAWPGNVRELQNAMEYAVVLARKDKISVKECRRKCSWRPGSSKSRAPAKAASRTSTTWSGTPSSRRWPSVTATRRKPPRSSASSARRFITR